MKKIALALAAVVVLLLPVSADGAPLPDHHGKPVVQRVIDWD